MKEDKNKKPLDYYRELSNEASVKASEVSRQLSLGGIAVIWLFRNIDQPLISFPPDLYKPLFFLVVALFFDLIQYVYKAIVWQFFFRYKEYRKDTLSDPNNVKASPWLSNSIWIFWLVKISCMIYAYYLLLCFFWPNFVSAL